MRLAALNDDTAVPLVLPGEGHEMKVCRFLSINRFQKASTVNLMKNLPAACLGLGVPVGDANEIRVLRHRNLNKCAMTLRLSLNRKRTSYSPRFNVTILSAIPLSATNKGHQKTSS